MTRPLRSLLLLSAGLLAGCVYFDKKSEAATFHDFAAAAVTASKSGPVVFIPRVQLPSAVRRLNVVIVDAAGRVRLEDMHRWVGPPDRLITEALGRQVTAATGLPTSLSAPDRPHLVLLITVERMMVEAPEQASLALRYRIERSNGELLKEGSGAWLTPLASGQPADFVNAQSNNLAKAAADISTELARLATDFPTRPQ